MVAGAGKRPVAGSDASPPLRIYLLGGFRVEQGSRRLGEADWPRRKARSLFKVLALRPGHRITRDQALDLFWPDLDPRAANNNLYRAIHYIRRVLEPDLADAASAYLVFEGEVLALRPSGIALIDVEEFARLARDGKDQGSLAALEQAAGLYPGELLPDDLYEDWASQPRQELQATYLGTLIRLANGYEKLGALEQAIDVLQRLLAQDSCNEVAHRDLMRLYALTGQRHLAIRQFQMCKETLRRELGIEVETETAELAERIAAGEIGSEAPPIPPVAPPADRRAADGAAPDLARSIVGGGPGLGSGAPSAVVVKTLLPIGHERELAELEALLQQAMRGQRQLVLLSGEAGIGKSTLAQTVLRRAAQGGARVLKGACYELEGVLPYGPFVDALRSYLRQHSGAEATRIAAEAGPAIGRLLPELAESRATDALPPSTETAQYRLHLFEGIIRVFSALATEAPVAVHLDDLHAADEATLQLFHYVVRNTASLPLFILVTFRDEGDHERPLRRLIGELYREKLCTRITLHRLDAELSRRLVGATLGGEVDEQLAGAIYRIAEGNPFYTVELTRYLQETGRVTPVQARSSGDRDARAVEQWQLARGATISVPPELGDVLLQRLERLGDEAVQLLGLAAVIGREFDDTVLTGASGLDDDRVLDLLDRMLAARLVEESGNNYRFGHALTREALYGSLSRPRRARLHGVVAATLERLPPSQRAERVGAIAYHYDQADQADKAIAYAVLAGDHATRVYANEVAIGHYRRALSRIEALDGGDPRRRDLLEKLGDVRRLAGDADAALDAYQQALIISNREAGSAAWLALHRKSAYAAVLAGRLDDATRHLGQALATVDGGEDDLEIARLHYVAAQIDWHRERYHEAFRSAQRSLEIAERIGSATETAQAYEMMALACHSLGEWQQGIEYELRRQNLCGPAVDAAEAFDVHL